MMTLIEAITSLFKKENPDIDKTLIAPSPQTPIVITIDYGYKVGDLAMKYETSGRGSGYISNGASWGDPGGDSYGSYQLETKKGTIQAYLKSVNDKFTAALKPITINSNKFKDTWRKLAKDDPDGFEQSQFNYLAEKPGGFNDALNYAHSLGWDVNNLAMQSAIFSTSNQSGGWKKGIFDKSGIKPTDKLGVQINKLYDARASYFKGLNINSTVKKNIIKDRTVDERKDCLKLIIA